MDTMIIWSTVGPAVGVAIAGMWRLLIGFRRMFSKVEEFIEDWRGTVARPGVPARAGVMERLDGIEHQLKPNSGESLRDAVNRIEEQLNSSSSGPS